jgi:hypothetical protein
LVDDSRFKNLLRRAGDEDTVMQRTILVIMDAYRWASRQTGQQRDEFDGFCLFWQVSGELGLALIGADSEVLSAICVQVWRMRTGISIFSSLLIAAV